MKLHTYWCPNCKKYFKTLGVVDQKNLKYCPTCTQELLKNSIKNRKGEIMSFLLRDIVKAIFKFRKQKKWSQEDLATVIGTSPYIIKKFEERKFLKIPMKIKKFYILQILKKSVIKKGDFISY